MSKLSMDGLRGKIALMLKERKERKFLETVELQINLKDYDPQKDKRFSGTVKLPHIPRPNLRICVIGDAAHLEEAKKIPKIETMDVEGLKNFNKVKKDVKKWAKKYQVLLATDSIVRQIPKLLGPILSKIGKFPVAITHQEPLAKRIEGIKQSIKFQLKKVLTINIAVANVGLTDEQIRQNISTSINFLVSLLKKGWQNYKTIYIKTTMGKSLKIYG